MNGTQNFGWDLLRGFLAMIDQVLFKLLTWSYEIFFDITSVEFISGEVVHDLFQRVQLILGIFMVFKLTILMIRSLVNPDMLSDQKSGNSAGQIVSRVMLCMIMISVIVPIHINTPNPNEYEKQVNNNGILFGTLYSLQYRILSSNTIGKFLLNDIGTDKNPNSAGDSNASQAESLKDTGKEFAAIIARGFVENRGGDNCEIKESEHNFDDPNVVFDSDIINAKCGKQYQFVYTPIIGGVIAVAFAIILIGFSVDVVERTLKIILIRLLSPIPILSMLDPGSTEKGKFANWVKVLTATYLDLFIRLAVVYFVVFLVKEILDYGIIVNVQSKSITAILIYAIIIYACFLFAKKAPKFIIELLGLKGFMQNDGLATLFGGGAMAVGGMMSGWAAAGQEGRSRIAGALKGGAGAFAQGAWNGADASVAAYEQGKALPLGSVWNQNKDLMAKMRTGDKDAHGGILGYAKDRLNYSNRERAARGLGAGRNALAAADYENKQYEQLAQQAKSNLDTISTAFERMKGIQGGKMSSAEFSKSTGVTGAELEHAYNDYVLQYGQMEKQLAEAKQKFETLDVKSKKAASMYSRMGKTRSSLSVDPDAKSIWTETYKTSRTVNVDDDTGIALDKSGNPIVDQNGAPSLGENARPSYTYSKDPKKYNGAIDDSTFASRGGGASGGGPGGPPPGGPR